MLILSIIALFAGPLLYQRLRAGGRFAKTLDRLLVVALVALVVLLLVPESIEEMGLAALAVMAAGYAVPGLLEMAIRRAAHALHLFSLAFALAGLGLHALLDGAGLAAGASANGSLALAIVLHRFGMGLALWLMVEPELGRRWAIGVLLGMAAATVAGYFASEVLIRYEGEGVVHVLHALITGVIIHSLVHRGHVHHSH